MGKVKMAPVTKRQSVVKIVSKVLICSAYDVSTLEVFFLPTSLTGSPGSDDLGKEDIGTLY
jgi:hypothetical protein